MTWKPKSHSEHRNLCRLQTLNRRAGDVVFLSITWWSFWHCEVIDEDDAILPNNWIDKNNVRFKGLCKTQEQFTQDVEAHCTQILWSCRQCCVNTMVGNNWFHFLHATFASSSTSCVNGASEQWGFLLLGCLKDDKHPTNKAYMPIWWDQMDQS